MRPNIWKQRILSVLMVCYFIFGYMPINAYNKMRGVYHVIGLPGEDRIPFTSFFILGYLLVYASICGVYLLAPNWESFKKIFWGFFWVTTIHYAIFLIYPVKMIWRPDIVETHNFVEWLSQWFFMLDQPYNCFPSLHVAYPTLAMVYSWRYFPRYIYAFAAMAILTAISVVLIKQHYILDTLGGMITALVVGVLVTQKQNCLAKLSVPNSL